MLPCSDWATTLYGIFDWQVARVRSYQLNELSKMSFNTFYIMGRKILSRSRGISYVPIFFVASSVATETDTNNGRLNSGSEGVRILDEVQLGLDKWRQESSFWLRQFKNGEKWLCVQFLCDIFQIRIETVVSYISFVTWTKPVLDVYECV